MTSIKQVAVVGGTHGNEFTGIYLLRQWEENAAFLARETLNVETVFANPKAFEENKRYIDSDLNRQFTAVDLNDPLHTNYEQSRAKAINVQLGPKGNARTDFIIDLHNTTSNMGPSLILLESDAFNRKLGAYVREKMPDSVIIYEDGCSMDEHYFLCSIAKRGVIVEIGPQPQAVLREDVMNWMRDMTGHILDFIDLYNRQQLPQLPETYTAYQYSETLKLPEDEFGERIGMVHHYVQDNDFKALKPGDPIITLFSGETMYWEGDYVAYPHFINEAAYYDNNLAMSLAKQIEVSTQD